ncbi:MAG TPA: hypothetical protein VNK95_09285, partial [Caldilineaceae bacterium]|nr:hypothetical protein [Caldilineaceae bacterium]
RPTSPLHQYTDVALRTYRIKSTLPVVGPLIEWIRHNMTVHIKEAYLDRIIEQQVNLNRLLVEEIAALQDDVARLQADVAELAQKRSDKTAANKEDGSA